MCYRSSGAHPVPRHAAAAVRPHHRRPGTLPEEAGDRQVHLPDPAGRPDPPVDVLHPACHHQQVRAHLAEQVRCLPPGGGVTQLNTRDPFFLNLLFILVNTFHQGRFSMSTCYIVCA